MANSAPFFVDNEVIQLLKNGVWIADDIEISHEPTRRLFARSLKKKADGYYLSIGRETKKIIVEDTAYFVQRIDGSLDEGYELLLSNEVREKLDPSSLSYKPGRLTCKIQNGKEEARFLHAPYFDLLKDLQEDSSSYYLEFGRPEGLVRIKIATKTP